MKTRTFFMHGIAVFKQMRCQAVKSAEQDEQSSLDKVHLTCSVAHRLSSSDDFYFNVKSQKE